MIECVAIDDEPIALSIIEEYCRRFGEIRLRCFTSPAEGLEYIHAHRPDLVFLDIEMNPFNGLELAKELPEGTLLIFTTAFSEYALEGFNVNAIDFLHKPIFYPRFEQAMKKALAWNVLNKRSEAPMESITLKSGYKNVVIDLDSILFIEAMDNYVKVFRKDLPTIVSQTTMREMENQLPHDNFFRVHRSFIVAKNAIDRYSNSRIYIHSVTDPIPVGRTYREALEGLLR